MAERDVGPALARLLVGTDFSRGARAALTRVARLPLAPRAEVVIAYVAPGGGDLFVDRGAEAAARKLLDAEVAALARLAPRRLRVRGTLVRGRPVAALFELARTLEPELLVLGRHGNARAAEVALGSTAERILQLANRPVLVVARPARAPYRRAVVGVDLEPGSLEVLAFALAMAGLSPREVTLVHAAGREGDQVLRRTTSDARLSRYRAQRRADAAARLAAELAPFPALAVAARQVIHGGDPREALAGEVARRKADLLVVGTHGRSGTSLMLLGSVAQALARQAPCDVLITPTPLAEP